jgi:hypothetical protein
MSDSSFIIVAIIVQAGILVYFAMRARKKKQLPPISTEKGSQFEVSRRQALSVTPAQLQLSIPNNTLKVYGLVMDWDMNGTTFTLNAYINGAANAILSSGASAIGTGRNPKVAELASDLVLVAQDFIGRTVPVTETGLPPLGTVRFYFLTNMGLFAAQEQLVYLDNETSPWVALFFRANMVINEIKEH